jgi:hypothetical protein
MGREHGATTMARICLNHLTERYGPVLAVDDVTVTLQAGKITAAPSPVDRSRARLICGRFRAASCYLVRV